MSSQHTRFGGRTLARSQALQVLFQAEACERTVEDVLEGDFCLDVGPLDPFGERLARGCDLMLADVDTIIAARASNWSLDRLPSVDRNLLRLALYEMMEVEEVDIAVTIDESVELAKAYGTDESPRFINGVLGRVADQLEEGLDVVEASREELHARGMAAPGELVEEEPEPSEDEGDEAEGAEPEDAEPEDAEDVEGGIAEGDEPTDPADEPTDPANEADLPDWAKE